MLGRPEKRPVSSIPAVCPSDGAAFGSPFLNLNFRLRITGVSAPSNEKERGSGEPRSGVGLEISIDLHRTAAPRLLLSLP